MTDGVSYATGYAYSGATGDLTGMTYPTGLALTFQRDVVGRISAVTAGGQAIAGNVAYMPFGPVGAMDLGAVSVTRTHDARYQVTGIQAGTALNYTYTRDGMGNITGLGGAPKPPFASGTTEYAYTANRLVSSTGAEPAAYTYDNAGNITSDGLHTDYFHNQNNRLIRVEIDGLTVAEYAYDAFERRVLKVVNGVTTHFHYDLNGLLISETDGNGNPRKDYVYLNGEPVVMKVYGGSAGWYWFINDHLGTPQKMVDESGTVVWAAAYAPFGEARVYADEIANNLRFPGQYYDVETGLHYNWHRFYDPGTGRYLTPDPIGLAEGMNLYAYVSNNPLNLFDLLGLEENIRGPAGFSRRIIDSVYTRLHQFRHPEQWGPGQGVDNFMFFADIASIGLGIGAERAGLRCFSKIAAEQAGRFRPNRVLPRDKYGRPVPDVDVPHTQIGTRHGRKGDYTQAREWDYGPKGELSPKRDIDFTNHGRPNNHPKPHQHDWIPNPTGGTHQHGFSKPLEWP